MIRKCLQCKKDFITYPNRIKLGNGKFCSHSCFYQKRKIRFQNICLFCKEKFEVHPYRRLTAKYCSRLCKGKSLIGKKPWNKGKPHLGKEKHPLWGKHHSHETIKKMSDAKKRLYESGRKVWNYGRHHSEVTKEKIRKARANQKNILRGENHYFWKGGISPLKKRIRNSFKYRKWKKKIFQTDNYLCQNCKIEGRSLEADHIKPMAKILEQNNIKTFEEAMNCEELWNINNGRTLCRDCHLNTDTWGRR